MSNRIVAKGAEHPDYLNGLDALFFEELSIRYKTYAASIVVTFLDNALLAGKVCPEITIHHTGFPADRCAIYNWLQAEQGAFSFTTLRSFLEQRFSVLFEQTDHNYYQRIDVAQDVAVSLALPKSTRTFSPFALSRLKPLKSVPEKLNLTHVRRALANGQFSNLRCNSYLTDDYADDAARNFRRGPIEAMPMIEELVTSPAGWWTHLDPNSNSVSLCCHQFDSNSFVLKV